MKTKTNNKTKITFLTDKKLENLITEDVDSGDFNDTKTSVINKILFDYYKKQKRI